MQFVLLNIPELEKKTKQTKTKHTPHPQPQLLVFLWIFYQEVILEPLA